MPCRTGTRTPGATSNVPLTAGLPPWSAHAARALEAEADRWFLWLPVLFAAGILSYFALSTEPGPHIPAALVLAAIGLFVVARHAPLGLALAGAFLAFALGFATAKLRTEMVRAPVLASELRYVPVTGYVEEFETRTGKRDRLTLRVIAIGDLPADARPYRVRISTAAKNATATTGEAVSLRATLSPPPEPVEPGGFDFARQAWFKRLGATGYATGRITPLADVPPPPWDLRAWAAIDSLRSTVNDRVRATLPGETGGVAVALMTGERGGIPQHVGAAQWVASWPGAVSILPRISGTALALIVLGGLWLCLWQTNMRALGLVIAAAGLVLAPAGYRPDVLVEREGATAALRGPHGDLIFPPATAVTYSVENWLLADGDDRDASALPDNSAFRCDPLGCIGRVKGKTVALVREVGALEEDCRLADIVIAPFRIGKRCHAARVIVDRRMLKEKGAHALYIEGLSIRTETVAKARGERPWARTRNETARPSGATSHESKKSEKPSSGG